MTEVVGEAVVKLKTDDSSVVKDAETSGAKAGKGFGSKFSSSMKGMLGALGIVAGAAAATALIKGSVDAARESEKVGATTVATIKATGGAANVTAAQIGDLATALSQKTGMDDEAIQTGENLLLTFKNIRNEVGAGNDIFNQATAAALDLSAAGFGSVDSASKTLGKALNDPVKGIAALNRVGVTFTQQQQDQVKAMQASGDMLGAQKLILKEVQGQVGGVAEATATASDKAQVAWGNLQEQVGGLLIPVIDALARLMVSVVFPAISMVISGLSNLGATFRAVQGFIDQHKVSMGILAGVMLTVLGPAFTYLAVTSTITFTTMVAGWIASAATAVVSATETFAIMTLLGAGYIRTAAQAVTSFVIMIGQWIAQGAAAVASGSTTIAIMVLLGLQYVRMAAQAVVAGLVVVGQWILMGATAVAQAVVMAAAWLIALGPIGLVIAAIAAVVVIIVILWKKSETFRTVVTAVWNGIKAAVSAVVEWFKGPFANFFTSTLPNFFRAAWDKVKQFTTVALKVLLVVIGGFPALAFVILRRFGPQIVAIFKNAWSSAKSAVTTGVAGVVSVIRGVPGKISALAGQFLNAGRTIGGKIIEGIRNGLSAAVGFATDIASAVKRAINSALGLPKTITVGVGKFKASFTVPAFAQGGVIARPVVGLMGEAGPEAVVPLRRGAPWAPGLEAAVASALAARGVPAAGPQVTINVYPPSGDPEAIGMGVLNRLAAVGIT